MAYQINLTGQEIDERLQNVGTPADNPDANGTLFARQNKNVDDIDELSDAVMHIQDAQKATDKTVTQHTADISTLQTALKTKANLVLGKVSVNELPVATSLGNPNNGTIPSTFAVSKAINDKIVGLLNWQGVKDTTDEIKDIALAKKGDVWHSNEDGSEWVCTEDIFTADHSVWEELGTPIDLSGYYTKNEVDKKVKPLADSIGTDSDAASANSSVYARIKKNQTDITDIDSRQTIIEKVVSGTQGGDVYFMKSWLSLVFNDSSFNGNIDNVGVKLYRWSGNRYAQFEMFTRNGTGVSQKGIGYKIILKQEKKDGANVRVPYIHYNDDGTEEELCTAVQNAFGGRISYNRYKKRRWRIQAFLNGKPITAPFDFRVSVDNNNNVSLTKGGMMRSVPASRQVKYDGYYDVNKWINCKVGEELDLNYCFFNEDLGLIRRKFPNPGDVMVENASSHTFPRGVIISVFQDTPGSYCILWSNGESIYEIGIDLDINEYGGYNCYFPAKKLCDDIYNYASKMNSGTLRDLYISAGAKYNEATGYYELNGLTDITEEEMRVIYNRWLIDIGTNSSASGWLILDEGERTNLPCITRADIFYHLDNGIRGKNVEVLRICAASTDDYTRICYVGNSAAVGHYLFPKLRKVIGVWQYNSENPDNFNFSYGQPFHNCPLLEEIRMRKINKSHTFAASPNLSKESVQYMIENANPPSGAAVGSITITLHPTAYTRLKDDADIVAALEAKGGIVTLVSA